MKTWNYLLVSKDGLEDQNRIGFILHKSVDKFAVQILRRLWDKIQEEHATIGISFSIHGAHFGLWLSRIYQDGRTW